MNSTQARSPFVTPYYYVSLKQNRAIRTIPLGFAVISFAVTLHSTSRVAKQNARPRLPKTEFEDPFRE